jgi:hypothetical protein
MGLLDIIAIVLIIAWLGGLGFHILGTFINILLVLAVISFLLRFIHRSSV